MTHEPKINSNLSEAYKRVYRIEHRGNGFKNVFKIITIQEKEILSLYREHGTLEGIEVYGIGKDSLKTLDMLLTRGIEETINLAVAERDNKIRKQYTKPREKLEADDIEPDTNFDLIPKRHALKF